MEFILWIVTGAMIGWLAYAFAGLNEDRGRFVSMLMGAVGALIGGKAIAPMFVVAPLEPMSVASFAFAASAAAVVLVAGNVVQNRWNV
jgi:uncharacterized membrane protein YeaQ/YmgE (transglycosylase-associated protein family)